jgi:hypothetical protein
MLRGYLQGAAVEYVDFRIAVLMIRVEYKEQQLRSINNEMLFNICCLFFKHYIFQAVSLT